MFRSKTLFSQASFSLITTNQQLCSQIFVLSLFLSAVDKGVYYTDRRDGGLAIESPDVAVVNVLTPGRGPSVIPVPLQPIKAVDGVAFNLFNNVWDVNFIFWYPFEKRDTNQKFRFKLGLSPS